MYSNNWRLGWLLMMLETLLLYVDKSEYEQIWHDALLKLTLLAIRVCIYEEALVAELKHIIMSEDIPLVISVSQFNLLEATVIILILDRWLTWLWPTGEIGLKCLLVAWFWFRIICLTFLLFFRFFRLWFQVFCPNLLLLRLALRFRS